MTHASRQFDGFLAAILGVVFGIVFGQMLLFGSLIKPITLFYQQKNADTPLVSPFVPESVIIDLAFTKFALNLAAGLAALIVFTLIKRMMLGAHQTRGDQFLFFCLSVGSILYTAGNLVVGWEHPGWETFNLMSLLLIAPGSGLIMWPAFVLFMQRLGHADATSALRERMLMALFAVASPLFIFAMYPNNIHTHVTSETSLHEFHMVYRSQGTLFLPITTLLVFTSLYSMVTAPDLEEQVVSMVEKLIEGAPVTVKRSHVGWKWMLSTMSFEMGRSLFALVFAAVFFLFPNFVVHFGTGDLHALTLDHQNTSFNALSPPLEDDTLYSVTLCLAGGMLTALLMLAAVTDFPKHENGVTVQPVFLNASFGLKFVFQACTVGSLVGWNLLAQREEATEGAVAELQALAFFLGAGSAGLFIDSLVSAVFHFGRKMVDEGERTTDRELRLLFMLTLMAVVVSCQRFATGFFGGLSGVVDFGYTTMILAILSGVTAGLELVTMASKPELCGGVSATTASAARVEVERDLDA